MPDSTRIGPRPSGSLGTIWVIAREARTRVSRAGGLQATCLVGCRKRFMATSPRHLAPFVATTPPMAQRYFMPSLPPPGPTTVTGDLAHHLGRVLRVVPGTPIVLGDGQGGTAAATVRTIGLTSLELEVERALHRPQPRRVEAAFAPPRLSRAEWLFEHGTEVGITAFHPLWTQRTRPQGERPERWLRIVRAAAGQCDRDWLPEVHAGCELADFLRDQSLPRRRF